MSPLSERSSKSCAKLMLLALWAAGAALAAPMPFFFRFAYVFDDLNGGLKPFCTSATSSIGASSSSSAAATATAAAIVNGSRGTIEVRQKRVNYVGFSITCA